MRRNDIVDDEIQGIKSEMISLADKILAIKVSSVILRFWISIPSSCLRKIGQGHPQYSFLTFLESRTFKEGARDEKIFWEQRLLLIMIQYKLCYKILTLFFQENLNGTTTFGATCQEYFERGSRRNGTYSIRPDLSRNKIQAIFASNNLILKLDFWISNKGVRSKLNACSDLMVARQPFILLIGRKKDLLFPKKKVKDVQKPIVTRKKYHMVRQKLKSRHWSRYHQIVHRK